SAPFLAIMGIDPEGPLALWSASERIGNGQHDELSERDTLDQQEGAVGAKNAERAFGLARPVRRQQTRGHFDKPKVLVCSCRQKRGIPKPDRNDDDEGSDKRGRLKRPAPGPRCDEDHLSIHVW